MINKPDKKLSDANKDLTDLANVISHDIRAPLRHIRLFAEFLAEDLEQSDQELSSSQLEALSVIKNSARIAEARIAAIVAISRLVSRPPVVMLVDLKEAFERATMRLADKIIATKASILVPDYWPSISGDFKQLELLFRVVLDNALKFHSRSRALNVSVAIENGADYVEIRITDNGIGLPEQMTDEVLVLFRSAHDLSADDGVGAGLTIGRKIAMLHGGDIAIESRSKGGACVIVRLGKTLNSMQSDPAS